MNTQCHLCGSNNINIIHKGTRDKKDIDVLKCSECDLVFLSSFDHIHNGYYEKSLMRDHITDSATWKAGMSKDNQRRRNQLEDIIIDKDVLDYGCGVGGFMSIIKDKAKYDVITMFHVIEHLEFAIDNLRELHPHMNVGGKLILETPNANDALLTLYHSEKFADFSYWSPHIFLYNEETLRTVAEKAGFKLVWSNPVQRYPLSNHLYWLSDGKPGGQNILECMNSDQLANEYENVLRKNGMCDTLLMCFESM